MVESTIMQIYNTLTGVKEELEPKKFNLFVCGPTVYDYSHIGHAKTYVAFDVIVKYLKYIGYKVKYLQNITDLDDKVIERARKEGKDVKELTTFFEKEYLKDMESLGIDSVNTYANATKYIKEIISQIEKLLKKDYAYQIEDGIYYDIVKFNDYGKLSKRTIQGAEDAVSRIDESVNKRNKGDFALWKFSEEDPNWKSPWGNGRPGWHIEDTAITEKNFGAQYEIHGGARDLLFPHHEAEIAQMEALSNKVPMSKYWMHTGFLTVNGEKMSKSKGNFVTIQDFNKEYSPRLLRFLIVKSQYRSPLDYTDTVLKQATKELERIDEFIDKLKEVKSSSEKTDILSSAKEHFTNAMQDDFNTPLALASIFELIREGNTLLSKGMLDKKDAKNILSFLSEIDKIFGFIISNEKSEIPKKVQELVNKREGYRENNEWDKADELRNEIEDMGWELEDIETGTKLKRV